MRRTIDTLPREVFVMCIAFAIDGQPAGSLEYIMVSKHWQLILLETPSLWSQVYIQNGEDETARISTFLHLSQNHSLHVDIMTVLPNMDSLQLIARDISRVATILIRPGPTETITYLYMEQWKRSASYILATLYNHLLPSLVLLDVDRSRCSALILQEDDHSFYWVIFMQFVMRTRDKDALVHCISANSSEDWRYFGIWQDHITRSIRGPADQVDPVRTSCINLSAGCVSYAQFRDAIKIAIPAFVTLLKGNESGETDTDNSVQVAARDALDRFADYVELRDALKLALIGQLGHPNTQIKTFIISVFVKLVHYAELRGSMMLSLPLLLELFDDPNFDTQMSTISRLRKLAEYDDFEKVLIVAILPLIELLGHRDPSIQTSAISVMKSLARYGEFDGAVRATILSLFGRPADKDPGVRASVVSVVRSLTGYYEFNAGLRLAILPIIELLGDKDPGVKASAVSVVLSLAGYNKFHAELKVAMPSVIERLGDKDAGIRTSAVFVAQGLAEYSEFRAKLRDAIPSVIERLGDKDPDVRTSAVFVVQSLAEYKELRALLKVAIPSVIKLLEDGELAVRLSTAFILDGSGHYSETTSDAHGMDDKASDLEVYVFHGAPTGTQKEEGGRTAAARE